jgi:hypothetical protein
MIENSPSHVESSTPSIIASDEFTTILLKKLMAIPQMPPIVSKRLQRNFI